MPFLDVADTALDADLSSRFTVVRRAQVVDANGWNNPTTTNLPRIVGVVTPAAPDDVKRLSESQRQAKAVKVVTGFALRGASKDTTGAVYEPDLVLYRGNYFAVTVIDDYTAFGGQVEAVCVMTDYTPNAPRVEPGP